MPKITTKGSCRCFNFGYGVVQPILMRLPQKLFDSDALKKSEFFIILIVMYIHNNIKLDKLINLNFNI